MSRHYTNECPFTDGRKGLSTVDTTWTRILENRICRDRGSSSPDRQRTWLDLPQRNWTVDFPQVPESWQADVTPHQRRRQRQPPLCRRMHLRSWPTGTEPPEPCITHPPISAPMHPLRAEHIAGYALPGFLSRLGEREQNAGSRAPVGAGCRSRGVGELYVSVAWFLRDAELL